MTLVRVRSRRGKPRRDGFEGREDVATPFDRPVISPILVGRDAQVAALQRCIEEAAGGAGQTVLVSGEAGVGKSRLVREASKRAAEAGLRVVQGNCFEPDRALPYAPFLDVLRGLLASWTDEEARRALAGTGEEMTRIVPELIHLFPEVPPVLEQSRKSIGCSTRSASSSYTSPPSSHCSWWWRTSTGATTPAWTSCVAWPVGAQAPRSCSS